LPLYDFLFTYSLTRRRKQFREPSPQAEEVPAPAQSHARCDRLKGTLKTEIKALHTGTPAVKGTPKKTMTPRKRKGKDDEANGEAEASPTKRGRMGGPYLSSVSLSRI
jgi:hypothetical protein